MDYNTLVETVKGCGVPQEVKAISLYEAFQQVTDGRKKRGVRYSVPLILTLILLGKLAGAKDVSAIAQWVRLRAEQLSQE